MDYTLEEIYCLVGKEDKTAGLTFKYESDSYKKYGSFITVVFLYTQEEREEMDKLIQNEPYCHKGYIRAKNLSRDLEEKEIQVLLTTGINSEDIAEILYFKVSQKNTFHSIEKRQIKKLEIKTGIQQKGGDYDWMYGFSKKLVNDGIGLCPKERFFYLAGRMFYEPENLTDIEKEEINLENQIYQPIEWEYLQIKYKREEITGNEKKRLAELYVEKKKQSFNVLDKYLNDAGSSLKKLSKENIDQAADLFLKVMHFHERRLNVGGKHPIYIDLDSYLHIYMRHVEEFQINNQFEHKDNFQWDENDVFSVMSQVIREIEDEYEDFRENNPENRFSRYGKYSLYYQGDYYTFHIEKNGRISTFHKNRKEHEKKPNR
ncbi:hypothetical protein R3X25_10555 [Lutibacter sp. TH_r2]|uniref:hypothetical protein n=1 Tax=Lutibacter sp. TH_r2 TaxID=3082083 RepID=UPI00295424CC|nr:hypothetical protein [Lutibacter sp. TH_r2]MDV7187722.1 hypothetical protein [Lutibacter sp. TH_r2]